MVMKEEKTGGGRGEVVLESLGCWVNIQIMAQDVGRKG